jgi:pimeloyl-ACP methyl ester carboxylesterase
LGAAAVFNWRAARAAERRNPPLGRFLQVAGVRLHYLEKGEGEPLVLLHGNGSMVQDWATSGVIDGLAPRHRVIAFDRPGYGHSARPRDRLWTPEAQADLLAQALTRLGVSQAVVVGHSWGAMVAAAFAQRHPERVGQLVLLSGYYFPSVRLDVALLSGPAVPVVGDLARHTVAPLLTRLIWPLLMRKIFGPRKVPEKFNGFPREMVWRPKQIRASSEETALMIPAAFRLRKGYGGLAMPVTIVAGEDDRVVSIDRQSARLHAMVPRSRFHRVRNHGHMVHQTATKDVLAAIMDGMRAEPF